ncbi:phage tail spike protein [Vagococcus sp.]|uniref:phage tail spike protein n=1 Tax=Vagococcus sp. TaxID=1933889 RepID=UPI003F9A18FA
MYLVKLDGQTFYDPRIEEYEIFDSKLKLEVNKAGAFDFTVYPTHPLFARIKKLKSIVEVYQDETLLFRGRVLDDELAFDRAKGIICEGELAYLNDTVLRPYEFSGGVREYLELLVDQHNSQVPIEKQFKVGTVTVKDPNDYIVRSDKTYPQTWDVVESKLIKSLGGYLIVRRENGVNYLDYLEDSDKKSLQKIELGQNLLDLATKSSATELYTAILPLGKEAESEDEEGVTSSEKGKRLTIESVNNGKDFIQDNEAVKKYGFLMKSVTWNDVTVATNLLNKAKQELAQLIKLSLTLDLTAIDLSLVDAQIDEFRVFEYVQVVSEPHGVDELLLVEKQELHLTNPSQDKLSIGYQRRTLTENQIQTDKAINNIDVIEGRGITSITEEYAISESKTDAPTMGWSVKVPTWEIGKYLWLRSKIVYSSPTETVYTEPICDTTWEAVKELEEAVDEKLNDKADNDYVTEVVTTLETSIEKESDSIRTEVKETYTAKSELSEYQEEVSSEFEQTKNSFNFNFKNLVEQISTLDHDTQVKFQEIVKYIRFENGNIILGQVGNELILKLQNNKIQFLQSGAEVAYFTNNKLYVTDGEFINSLRLGSFAFIPRDNGSLDFKKVVN